MACLHLDLDAQMYFARVATAYLYHGSRPDDLKSLILISSSVGLVEHSGIPVYSVCLAGQNFTIVPSS